MDVYQRRRLVALSILAGVFVVIVLLIKNCGGDDEETPVTPVSGATGPGGPTSLSQNEFIEEGDATCLESNTALASVDDADPTIAATEEGQILAGELDSLQTLPPPTDGENDLEDFLSALQDQVAAYDRYITAFERGDDTAAAELEAEIDEAGRKARKRARQFGFEVCGDTSEVGEASGEETTSEGVEEVEGGAVEEAPTETAPIAPVEPVTPAPTTPAPAPEPAPAPPAEGGGATPEPAPAPPTDGGGGTGSGGVSP
jgi:hypothetical protein